MGLFEHYLSVWIGLAIVVGVGLGAWFPDAAASIAAHIAEAGPVASTAAYIAAASVAAGTAAHFAAASPKFYFFFGVGSTGQICIPKCRIDISCVVLT